MVFGVCVMVVSRYDTMFSCVFINRRWKHCLRVTSLDFASCDGLRSPLAGVADYELNVPSEAYSLQNFPKAFNPSPAIRYSLPNRSHVTLTVFNTLGQQVGLLRSAEQEAGYHEVKFDGSGLASGVYFYRIHAGDFIQSRKLTLLK